jgi:hypothetical protein
MGEGDAHPAVHQPTTEVRLSDVVSPARVHALGHRVHTVVTASVHVAAWGPRINRGSLTVASGRLAG